MNLGRISSEVLGDSINIEIMGTGQPVLVVPKSELINLIRINISSGILMFGKDQLFKNIFKDLQNLFLPILQKRMDKEEKQRASKLGYTYFVLDVTTNAIKIGRSFRPKKKIFESTNIKCS